MKHSPAFALAGLALLAAHEHAAAAPYKVPVPIAITTDVGNTASEAGAAVTMTGRGSGTNGPETAQFGANLSCTKDNWQTTSSVGEIDCLNIALHQGGPGSDASGILIGTQNTGLGYTSDIEMQASSINPRDDSNPYFVDIQMGVVNKGMSMYGAVFNAVKGAGDVALFATDQGSAYWQTLLEGTTSNGSIYFKIDGSGNVTTKGGVQSTSLTTSGPLHAEAGIVSAVAASRVIDRKSCGTTLRGTAARPITLVVPDTLPVGCHIDVIQASAAAIGFAGRGMRAEHLGTPAQAALYTTGRYAEADLFVDSAGTFLLRGDVGAQTPGPARDVSYVVGLGEDPAPVLLR